MNRIKLLMGIVLLSASPSLASPITVSLGETSVQENATDQQIQVYIQGDQEVHGVDLYTQIGDGGSYDGGSDVGPKLSGGVDDVNVDVTTGTIFASAAGNESYNENSPPPAGPPMNGYAGVVLSGTSSVGVADYNGSSRVLLATITLDTTGLFAATTPSFTISFDNVDSNDGPFNTDLIDTSGNPITVTPDTNGDYLSGAGIDTAATINLVDGVPEPAAGGLFCAGALAALLRRRRRH